MIEYKHEDLFRDGTDKQLSIVSADGKVNITNSEIHYEQFELKESLCSQSELTFGACEASQIKFKIANVFTSMVGMQLAVTTTLEGQKDAPFSFGKYKVVSDKPTADRRYRNITAYDAMYDILNAEVSRWYNSLAFPMKLRAFRYSFCAYMGVEQEEITLVNDDMIIEKTIDPEELSGKTVIEAICEINGCFGHIGRNGKLRYVVLEQMIEGLYPADDRYPADDLYPADPMGTTEVSRNNYISCQYEDFICQHIDKLQIRQEENDIGAIAGNGNNCYIIEDNFLIYGKSAADLQTIADNVLSVIGVVWYRPAQVEARGNPCLEVGDGILLHTTRETIYTYILQRTLKGIQALKDSYTAEGEEYRTGQVNGIMKSIIQLKGKSNVLTRTVEETKLELKDVNENLSAQISINAQQILTKVSKDNIVSEINQTAESIKIKAERIDLVGIVNADEMVVKYATIENLNITKLELNNLIATKATIDSLNAVSARLSNVESNYISAGTVKANYMEVANWTSSGVIKADRISAATIVNKLSSVDLVSVRAMGVSGYMNYKGTVVAWRTKNISGTVITYLGPED
jgi:hypothetical protein